MPQLKIHTTVGPAIISCPGTDSKSCSSSISRDQKIPGASSSASPRHPCIRFSAASSPLVGFFFGFVFHVRDLLTLRGTTTLTLPRYVYIFSTNESTAHLMCLTHFSPCMADAQTASPPGKGATVITGCPFIVTHCSSLHMAHTSLHIRTNLQLN